MKEMVQLQKYQDNSTLHGADNLWRRIAFYSSLLVLFVLPWRNAIIIQIIKDSTIGFFVGLLFAVAWVVSVLYKKKIRRPHAVHVAFAVFTLWNAVSVIWSRSNPATVVHTIQYVYILSTIIAFWDIYTTRVRILTGLQFFVLGSFVFVAGAVLEIIRTPGVIRVVPLGLNPNLFASHAVLAIPVAYYLAVSEDSPNKYRYISSAYILLSIPVVFFSGSRTGSGILIVLISIITIHISIQTDIYKYKYFGIIIILAFSLAGWSLLPNRTQERLLTLPNLILNSDLGNREEIWLSGFEIFKTQPVLGVGSGNFTQYISLTAHNVYLSILVELGVVGLILFITTLLLIFRSCMRCSGYKYVWASVLLCYMLISFGNDMGFITGIVLLNLVLAGTKKCKP